MTTIKATAFGSLLLLAAAGCENDTTVPPRPEAPAPAAPKASLPAAEAAPQAQPVAGALTLVSDPSQVCMVNNQFMGTPQIPVPVNGKTYYGCCEMCKGRLANDPSSRTAVDPVSQVPVDKANAVMARSDKGQILYFENARNFQAYAATVRAN